MQLDALVAEIVATDVPPGEIPEVGFILNVSVAGCVIGVRVLVALAEVPVLKPGHVSV